jgi:hypothetical protein
MRLQYAQRFTAVIALPFGMDGGPATEALPVHPVYELLASVSGVNVHRNRFRARRDELIIRERSLSLGGCGSGHQLLKGADRTSCMNELVFNTNSEVFVEAIPKVDGRIPSTCHQFLEQHGILWMSPATRLRVFL